MEHKESEENEVELRTAELVVKFWGLWWGSEAGTQKPCLSGGRWGWWGKELRGWLLCIYEFSQTQANRGWGG